MKKKKWYRFLLAAVAGLAGLLCSVPVMAAGADTRQYVVVLDPGHGGVDSGACSSFGGKSYKESDINWKIAGYAKAELEKNGNIKVYLTRKQNNCPTLDARVQTAKKVKADILVSLHNNSDDSGRAQGASVLISQGNYRPELAEKEKLFGSYVMSELGKLGIHKRFPETGGMEYRLKYGTYYPNGKTRDYYSIVAGSVLNNLPGVIIEHAFISNYSDVKNYLGTDASLKKLGQADARAIVRYLNQLSKTEEPESPDSKNGWKTIAGKTYFFQKDGKAKHGWMEQNGDWYFFNTTYGYLYKNTRITTRTGNIYIFDKNGKRCKGWTTYGGQRYYIGSRGCAVKGFSKIGKYYYYFDSQKATLCRNRKLVSRYGNIYYIKNNGTRCTSEFYKIKENGVENTYYFGKDGKAYKGWLVKNGKKFYFYGGTSAKAGVMAKSVSLTSRSGVVSVFNKYGVCVKQYKK